MTPFFPLDSPLFLFSLFFSFFLLGDALEQNFVFSSLDNVEKQMLANAMEQVSVCEGEDLITQGVCVDYVVFHSQSLNHISSNE